MKLKITDDQAEELVIEMLKNDMRTILGLHKDLDILRALAGVLKYYMPKADYEAFVSEIGYIVDSPKEDAIHVVDVVDNPDGSADLTVELTDEKLKKSLIEEGLGYVLLKNAFNLTSDDVVRLVQRGKKKKTKS